MITRKSFDAYERIKCIGKGAFGTAVLYKRFSDNSDVVIKEIFLSDMTDGEKQLAFNEVNVLASLNHSNIIRYLGSFEKDGSLFIEMEYANNGNLAQLINLRKERNRVFKELDICEGKDYDEKSDIWAVGCILYELACFRKPFEALNLPSLVQKISMCEYDDVPEMYSQNMSQLLRDILQKDFSKRPSALEIHDTVLPQIKNILTSNENYSTLFKEGLTERSVLYQLPGFGDDMQLCPIELPPKKIISFSGSETHFIAVTIGTKTILLICAAGHGFSIFLSEHGLLYTCGDGRKGCLGHNSWNNVLRPTIIDRLITTCITQVKCGTNHVVALTSDHKVYTWGSSSYGQLGLGHEKFCNVPILVDLSKETIIKKVFANYNSSAIIEANGDLLVCGDNAYGKLGAQEDKVLYFKKTIKDKVVSINIGLNHSMMITQNKKTIGMGKNSDGQLGTGNCDARNCPQAVQFPLNVIMTSCGETFTAAGTDSNAVYVWGKYIREATSSKYLQKDNDSKPQAEVTELMMTPKCVLALYASKERLKAGHKIWLESIDVLQNSLFIVVHTTAPPPLKKIQIVHNNNRSNVPDWMDTNIDFNQTTLPNTPQFT
ncbi:hypothetical protein RN001_004198 [Aquatica leii]|uniref:non-specific serine/threonine protein kinase n=1 Tax=Aquatica leii TaxID=1421715 RepID=A0AAN7PY23_9COLE|nr:hypothetical protein RN001_004198 [Aquatica leii]